MPSATIVDMASRTAPMTEAKKPKRWKPAKAVADSDNPQIKPEAKRVKMYAKSHDKMKD